MTFDFVSLAIGFLIATGFFVTLAVLMMRANEKFIQKSRKETLGLLKENEAVINIAPYFSIYVDSAEDVKRVSERMGSHAGYVIADAITRLGKVHVYHWLYVQFFQKVTFAELEACDLDEAVETLEMFCDEG